DDCLPAGDHLGGGRGQFFGVAAERAQEVRLAVTHGPPVAGVALVPVPADAGFAGPAVVEDDGQLARLGPFHHVLPLARVEAVGADVVLDDVGGVRPLEVAHLA